MIKKQPKQMKHIYQVISSRGTPFELKKESRGWIYRHASGAGHSGHHRNQWRAYQMFVASFQN